MSSFAQRRDWRVADLSMAPFGRKEIHLAEHEMPGLRALHGFGVGEGERAETALHGAVHAEFFGEGAGIDLADAGNAVLAEVGVEGELAAPVADDGGEFADDEAAGLGPGGLGVCGANSVVADLHGGHRDDLAEVGGVGEDLLVAGHRGVEHALAGDGRIGPEGEAAENGTVFERENCGFGRGH